MSDLNLNLPKIEQPEAPKAKPPFAWRALIIVLLCACLIGIWMPKETNSTNTTIQTNTQSTPLPKGSEDIIIKLKKGGAFKEAAELLGSLAHQKGLSNERKARLLKRQGDLYVQADEFNKALQAFYFSEMANNKQDTQLERETTQAIITLLRNKGQYSAVSSELATKNRQRLGQSTQTKDPIVAKVDGMDIPLSDFEVALDKHINQRIQMLTNQIKDTNEIKRISEQTKKQFHAPYEKLKYLNQWIGEEILYREALSWKIDQSPDYINQLETIRKQLLRQHLLQNKVQVNQVSDTDLKNYVNANRTTFGLSTDPGQLNPEAYASVRDQAELKYREEKTKEIASQFQAEVSKRHKVEIFQKVFTEGGKNN